MTAQELRQKFLKFFESKDHKIIPSVSLVPSEKVDLAGTQKVLFTTAGMHPLVPYLLGKGHPEGKRLVNVQRSLRTDDIEEVGDATHNTFFEMLGNWSLGDYWKKEAIGWSYEFLTKALGISSDKLAVTIFEGDKDAPQDEESAHIWKQLGIHDNRIFPRPKRDNWWGPVGQTGPCGPDTEMFVWTGKDEPHGIPNEEPLWIEVWNDVFMQYNKKNDGKYEPLEQKNVDTGMGLERMLMVLQDKETVYETDVFQPLASVLGEVKEKGDRIFLDHMRAAVMIIADGVEPSNKDRGYILRRLIRRSIAKAKEIKLFKADSAIQKELQDNPFAGIVEPLVEATTLVYKDVYPHVEKNKDKIISILNEEVLRFGKTVGRGLKEFEKAGPNISGEEAFGLYQSFGFPIELTLDLAKERGWTVDKEGFDQEYKKHQEVSRIGLEQRFIGGLAGHSETEIKYHTATHLLHQALRDVLGPTVFQKGSNITPERLRFDFSFDRKLTDEEIKKVEDIINESIKENLKVDRKIVSPQEAKKLNAIGLFDEKYGSEVSIYGIGPGYKLDPKAKDQRDRGDYYSLEFCGGPHVEHTGVIGAVKITKEEAISSGIRRIKAEIVLR